MPPRGREEKPPVVRVSHEAPGEPPLPAEAPSRQVASPIQVQLNPKETPQTRPSPGEAAPPRGRLPPVTLHLDDVDVRKALEMLSRDGAVNILVSPGVRGRVTANLTNMSFDEALGGILKLCNLVAHQEKGILFVYTPEEYAQSDKNLRLFPLDHASTEDVEKAVQGLLSPGGKVFVTQSNMADNRKTRDVVVVEDGPNQLRRIEQYLSQIDRPARQVLIEAHVLQVELKDEKHHGVDFKHLFEVMNNQVELQLHGLANPAAPEAFFINLKGGNLTALIECLESTTDAKTLASPKILVMNGQKARIQIGEKLGYRVILTTETSSMEQVKFLEVGVVLDVSPRISRDNQVALRVKPKVSSGRINPGSGLPEEKTTETETDVLMSDGQGMVIGGLIQEKDEDKQAKIPFLGDIWLIGKLFQRRAVEKSRSEIIITLLPRVLPYPPEYEAQEQQETMRAETPLVEGPLCRYPRTWEPILPDAIRNPRIIRPPWIDPYNPPCE